MEQPFKIIDEVGSCNNCRIGRNQIGNQVVENDQLKSCITVCTRCNHRDSWIDGAYITAGNSIKTIEYERIVDAGQI